MALFIPDKILRFASDECLMQGFPTLYNNPNDFIH